MEGVPFLREGKIVFPEGELTLDKCTLEDAEALFGQSAFCPQKHGLTHRFFLHHKGEVVVFFVPGKEINALSPVVGIEYIFDQRPTLQSMAEFFGVCDSSQIACVPHIDEFFEGEEQFRFFAILNLNVHLVCLVLTQLTDRISFVSTGHILNCSCRTCKLIRSICGQKGI